MLAIKKPPPNEGGLIFGGWGRNRTGVHGFAGRCITTLPPSQTWIAKEPVGTGSSIKNWSGKRDSNSRPQPWQGCALPTELFPRRARHSSDEATHVNKPDGAFRRISRFRWRAGSATRHADRPPSTTKSAQRPHTTTPRPPDAWGIHRSDRAPATR